MTFNPQKKYKRHPKRISIALTWFVCDGTFSFAHSLLSFIHCCCSHTHSNSHSSHKWLEFSSFIFLLRWADAIFVVKHFKWFFFWPWLNDLHTLYCPFSLSLSNMHIEVKNYWLHMVRVLCSKCHSHTCYSLFLPFSFSSSRPATHAHTHTH